VLGGVTVIKPVSSGHGWSGVVVRQLLLVVSFVVQAVDGRDAHLVSGAAVVLISTSETSGGAHVDFDIVDGRSLSPECRFMSDRPTDEGLSQNAVACQRVPTDASASSPSCAYRGRGF